MDVTVLLFHADDVWRVIWFILIDFVLIKGEEAKLEEVLDDNGDLGGKQNESEQCQRFPFKHNKECCRKSKLNVIFLWTMMQLFFFCMFIQACN